MWPDHSLNGSNDLAAITGIPGTIFTKSLQLNMNAFGMVRISFFDALYLKHFYDRWPSMSLCSLVRHVMLCCLTTCFNSSIWVDIHILNCEKIIWNDDVIKWKHFPRYWTFVRGIHRSPGKSPPKACDAELWCFLSSVPEQTVDQTTEAPVIWDANALIMPSF